MTHDVFTSEWQTSSVIAQCDQAAECIRAVNHLTHCSDGAFGYPADAYRALDALQLLVHRLPQALGQIQRAVQRMIDTDHVVMDPGTPYAGDPAGAGRDLRRSIAAATVTLHAVEGALDRATQTIAHAALVDCNAS